MPSEACRTSAARTCLATRGKRHPSSQAGCHRFESGYPLLLRPVVVRRYRSPVFRTPNQTRSVGRFALRCTLSGKMGGGIQAQACPRRPVGDGVPLGSRRREGAGQAGARRHGRRAAGDHRPARGGATARPRFGGVRQVQAPPAPRSLRRCRRPVASPPAYLPPRRPNLRCSSLALWLTQRRASVS